MSFIKRAAAPTGSVYRVVAPAATRRLWSSLAGRSTVLNETSCPLRNNTNNGPGQQVLPLPSKTGKGNEFAAVAAAAVIGLVLTAGVGTVETEGEARWSRRSASSSSTPKGFGRRDASMSPTDTDDKFFDPDYEYLMVSSFASVRIFATGSKRLETGTIS